MIAVLRKRNDRKDELDGWWVLLPRHQLLEHQQQPVISNTHLGKNQWVGDEKVECMLKSSRGVVRFGSPVVKLLLQNHIKEFEQNLQFREEEFEPHFCVDLWHLMEAVWRGEFMEQQKRRHGDHMREWFRRKWNRRGRWSLQGKGILREATHYYHVCKRIGNKFSLQYLILSFPELSEDWKSQMPFRNATNLMEREVLVRPAEVDLNKHAYFPWTSPLMSSSRTLSTYT